MSTFALPFQWRPAHRGDRIVCPDYQIQPDIVSEASSYTRTSWEHRGTMCTISTVLYLGNTPLALLSHLIISVKMLICSVIVGLKQVRLFRYERAKECSTLII